MDCFHALTPGPGFDDRVNRLAGANGRRLPSAQARAVSSDGAGVPDGETREILCATRSRLPVPGGEECEPMHELIAHEADIRRLLAEYCHHFDDVRPDQFAALFTEDAVFGVFGRCFSGRVDIRDNIAGQASALPPGQHVTYNTVIDLDDDAATARARTDFLYLSKNGDGYAIAAAGRYDDVLERQPDRWRIKARTIVFLGDPVPEELR